MSLDPNPARPLTSREIAKAVGAVLGGFVSWCGAAPVIEALQHIVEHQNGYIEEFLFIEYATTLQKGLLPPELKGRCPKCGGMTYQCVCYQTGDPDNEY